MSTLLLLAPKPQSKKPKNDFVHPPLRHTAKHSIPTVNNWRIASQNKFATQKEKTLTGNPTQTPKPTSSTPSKPKIRDITIIKTANYKQLISEIAGTNNQRKFHARAAGEFIRLDSQTEDDYRAITKFLIDQKIESSLLA